MNIFENDSTYRCGGGIYGALYSDLLVSNNIIRNNKAVSGGGGISFGHNASGHVINNVIFNNLSPDNRAGGIYAYDHSYPVVANCIFWADSGGEIGTDTTCSVAISYSDIEGGYAGEGNISMHPLFHNPLQFDFRLKSIACGDSVDSPCIDAGDPNLADSLVDCIWGMGMQRSDMGAFGGGDSAAVEIRDFHNAIPEKIILLNNYPNPFNSSTNIRYFLPADNEMSLDIFDILGRRVCKLYDNYQRAGYHQSIWNAGNNASGVYFYRIQTGDYSEVRRLMLLR
jgi:hypothetical protein